MIRGGVEDTRLEAKAKGQPLRGQDTLEAQGQECSRGQGQGPRTQAQALSKKKRSSQHFFRRSQKKKKKVFTKIFQAISH